MPYAHPNNEEGLGTLQVLAETNIGNDPACFTPTENTGTTTNYRVSMYSFVPGYNVLVFHKPEN